MKHPWTQSQRHRVTVALLATTLAASTLTVLTAGSAEAFSAATRTPRPAASSAATPTGSRPAAAMTGGRISALATGDCTALVTVQTWPGGYLANVTVMNLGTQVSSWTIPFDAATGVPNELTSPTNCGAGATAWAPQPFQPDAGP